MERRQRDGMVGVRGDERGEKERGGGKETEKDGR